MADPVTLAVIASSAALAGSGVSALASYQQGQATKAADSYNQQVENVRATEAQNSSQAQAQIGQQQTTEKIAAAGAAYGAGGVDTSGTPLLLMSSLASKGELNRRLTLYQGETSAASDVDQAQLDQMQGTQAATAGDLQAGASLLTGAGKFAGSFGGSTTTPSGSSYTSPASNIGSSGLHVGGT